MVLRREDEKQYVAIFRDDGPKAEWLPVLVRIPDLDNLHPSYGRLLEALSKSLSLSLSLSLWKP